jgi:hypothetical protein
MSSRHRLKETYTQTEMSLVIHGNELMTRTEARSSVGRSCNYQISEKFRNTKQNFTVRGCIQKFPDWLPGARAANGKAVCH